MIPATVSFSKTNLQQMAAKHRSLYIKPDVGSLGIGIFKMSRQPSGYMLKMISGKKQVQKTFKTLSAVHRHIHSKQKKKMIIQKAIPLDKVDRRSYDIRGMIQRKPKGAWTCTGFIVRVGKPNKIVTNVYQGGKVYTLPKLHSKQGLTAESAAERTRQITSKGLTVAKMLSRKRSGMRELGIDFAYDKKGHLWILEVNSNHPQFYPIKNIDRAAYNRMLSFAKSYGRHSAR